MEKICIIHSTQSLGGGTKSFFDVIKMLKKDYDVIACIPDGAIEICRDLENIGVVVYFIESKIPIFPFYSGGAALLSSSMFRALLILRYRRIFAREIDAIGPDAVIFNTMINVVSSKFIKPHIKKICIVRETFNNSILSRYFYNTFEKYFAGVSFLSEGERKIAHLTKPITEVIPDCLDPQQVVVRSRDEARKMESIDEHSFVILFMGGDSHLKGIHVILKTMNLLAKVDRNYMLLIAGSFSVSALQVKRILKRWFSPRYIWQKVMLRQCYLKGKSNGNVRVLGYRNDISSVMNACDVVTFPSISAHQPRPGIEAGEYKRPIIISDFEATREYFIDGYNALVFRPNNYIDLAKKIISLRENPSLAKELGNNNYYMTQTFHNYKNSKEKLKAFLRKCL